MEAIKMVLVTLVLATAGVLTLALVARLAARTERRSTGPRFPGSLDDGPREHLAAEDPGDEADDRGSGGWPATLDTTRAIGSLQSPIGWMLPRPGADGTLRVPVTRWRPMSCLYALVDAKLPTPRR